MAEIGLRDELNAEQAKVRLYFQETWQDTADAIVSLLEIWIC